jgi:hypothetical protein
MKDGVANLLYLFRRRLRRTRLEKLVGLDKGRSEAP